MATPRARSSRTVLAALLAAAFATGLRAEDKPAAEAPQATVPLPAPAPPPRPDELKSVPALDPNPAAQAPLPPERPAALSDGNAGGAMPEAPQPPPRPPELSAPALLEAPLPPERPTELKDANAPLATSLPDAPPPPRRPPELSSSPTALPLTIHPAQTPLPPERPREFGDGAPLGPLPAAPLPPARPEELSTKAMEQAAIEVPEDTACLRSLDTLGVKYKKLPPIVNGQCTVAHPLDLESIGDGVSMNSIAVTADQMIVCGVAEGLGRWAKEAQEAAEKELGDKLKGLTLGGGYHCRGMNNVGDAKLSEHAFANAMDIMGFTFAKHAPIIVSFLPEGSPEAKFLDSVRASACKYFRTVLGPGSNEAHANHLHFDQRQRAGDHRICELRPVEAASAPAKSGEGKNAEGKSGEGKSGEGKSGGDKSSGGKSAEAKR